MNLTPSKVYFEHGMFHKIPFTEKDNEKIFNILFFTGNVDAFCPKCEKDSILISINNFPSYKETSDVIMDIPGTKRVHRHSNTLDSTYYGLQTNITKTLQCSRCKTNHQFYFETSTIDFKEFTLKKIGQSFSTADYQNHSIKKYRKTLGKELYIEFSKAVGLFSHGVGIGSFVYLRRIIEKFVIQEAYIKESSKPTFDKVAYTKERVKEKIDLLKESLPDFLVSNKTIYGILSKGIHELSEEECLEIFPTLQTSIEYILDEIKAKKELEEKKKKISNQINKINSDLGKNPE